MRLLGDVGHIQLILYAASRLHMPFPPCFLTLFVPQPALPTCRQVFLWRNTTKTVHPFPNLQTFTAMGFDFEHELVVTDWQLKSLKMGDTLPSMG